MPEVVMETHSKRAAEIQEAIDASGYHSYQARNIAARNTRAPKRHSPVGELLPRWVAEIEATGHSIASINRDIEVAARERPVPEPQIAGVEARDVATEALAPEGPLAARKVFARRDVIVAVAPALYGHDPAELTRVVDRALADPEAVPLIGVRGATDRAYATGGIGRPARAVEGLVLCLGDGTLKAK